MNERSKMLDTQHLYKCILIVFMLWRYDGLYHRTTALWLISYVDNNSYRRLSLLRRPVTCFRFEERRDENTRNFGRKRLGIFQSYVYYVHIFATWHICNEYSQRSICCCQVSVHTEGPWMHFKSLAIGEWPWRSLKVVGNGAIAFITSY